MSKQSRRRKQGPLRAVQVRRPGMIFTNEADMVFTDEAAKLSLTPDDADRLLAGKLVRHVGGGQVVGTDFLDTGLDAPTYQQAAQIVCVVNEQVFLAIDAGTERAGFCVARGQQHIESGQLDVTVLADLHSSDGSNVWVRIERLGVWAAVMCRQHSVDFVVLELPMGDHGNKHTDRVLGACLGGLIVVAQDAGARRVLCTPQEVRATGYHKGAKQQAAWLIIGTGGNSLDAAAWRESETKMTGDQADAIGLWQAGWHKVARLLMGGRDLHGFRSIDVIGGKDHVG